MLAGETGEHHQLGRRAPDGGGRPTGDPRRRGSRASVRADLAPLIALGAIVPLLLGAAGARADERAGSAWPGELESVAFRDRATESGLEFTHFNGMTGNYYFPEMTGQGGGLFDYDNDGDLDVYLIQGALLRADETMSDALFPPPTRERPVDRLFRNDSFRADSGDLVLRFVDVTRATGLRAEGYGMGVAVGDVDGDGWSDLYVTNYGPNQLYRNRGDGTFEDVTAQSGTGDPLWGTSATFFDFDNDGREDLYVVNYVEFDVEANPRCFASSSRRDYCGPDAFRGQPDRLFRNLGDGRFEDVTSRALPGYEPGPGLGVATADFNGDGLVDLYVANDGRVNQLWINGGDGTFVEEALFAGAGLNRRGLAEASMGVDVADFDNDGDEDIFLTHLMGETNTLYVNDGSALFEDRTLPHGLAALSLPYTSFGTAWIDVDNDGLLDLIIASGAVRILEDQASSGDPYPLKQPNALLRNVGGRFEDVSARAGDGFADPEVSRGLSLGDVDNDGDLDVVLHNNNGPARLLVNEVGSKSHWVGLAVRPVGGGAVESGAVVEVGRAGDGARRGRARKDGSYCSSRDPRVVIGLASDAGSVRLAVRGNDGVRRAYSPAPTDRYVVVYDSPSR